MLISTEWVFCNCRFGFSVTMWSIQALLQPCTMVIGWRYHGASSWWVTLSRYVRVIILVEFSDTMYSGAWIRPCLPGTRDRCWWLSTADWDDGCAWWFSWNISRGGETTGYGSISKRDFQAHRTHLIPPGLNPYLPCKRVCMLLPDHGTLQEVQAWDPIVHPRSMQLKHGESQCSFEFHPVCYCTWGLVENDSEFWLLNGTDCWFVSLLESGIEANRHSSHTTAFWYTSCILLYFSTYCWGSVYQN